MCNSKKAQPKAADGIIKRPSPNFGDRHLPVNFLILHYTAMDSAESAISWLCNPKSGVSSHYVVGEEGKIYSLVDEDKRAWHAGNSYWEGTTDINSASIGIEIVNTGDQPYPQVQMDAVADLCRAILSRHNIPALHVIGHSDIAPTRKQDPGSLFDWQFLAANSIGVWPAPSKEDSESSAKWDDTDLHRQLVAYGYSPHDDKKQVLIGFQRHFQQEVFRDQAKVGVADADTKSRLAWLVRFKSESLKSADVSPAAPATPAKKKHCCKCCCKCKRKCK